MFGPTYEKVSEQYPNITFAKVDTEAEQELAGYFQIRSIPTLMAFKDQIGVFSQPGALPEDALIDLIGQIEGLDMDEVRKEIENDAKSDEGHDHGVINVYLKASVWQNIIVETAGLRKTQP